MDAKLEERFADAGGCRLRYFVGGEGPPLLLIHGLGGSAENWVELVPRLSSSFTLLVPELPGHGRSAPLDGADLTDYAERVGAIAREEGFLPGGVVGHSLGGLVALRLALLRPDDVRGLVLVGAAGISSTRRRARFALRVLSIVKPARYAARYRRAVARSDRLRYLVFGRWGAADPPALSESAVEGFLAGPLLHTDTASAARAVVLDDPRTELEDLRCPCLLLWGARDNQLPIDDAFDFVRRLRSRGEIRRLREPSKVKSDLKEGARGGTRGSPAPKQLPIDDAFDYARRLGADLRVIADCGHLLIGERPDACADAITEFFNRGAQI